MLEPDRIKSKISKNRVHASLPPDLPEQMAETEESVPDMPGRNSTNPMILYFVYSQTKITITQKKYVNSEDHPLYIL